MILERSFRNINKFSLSIKQNAIKLCKTNLKFTNENQKPVNLNLTEYTCMRKLHTNEYIYIYIYMLRLAET